MKKVAIIILNYNDFENTSKYVNQIKSYQCIDKIVVVDNLSSANEEFRRLLSLRDDKVDVIQSDKNGGYAYGNNVGIHYVESLQENYPFIIISNPDVEITQDAIEKTIEHLEKHSNVGIASPAMYYKKGERLVRARRGAWKKRTIGIDIANGTRITQALLYPLFKKGEYRQEELKTDVVKVFAVAGSFFIAKLSALQEIDYLDENTFLFYEEDILGEKMQKKGYEIHLLPSLSFVHYDSQCIGKLMSAFKKQDILFQSRIYYQKKYHQANSLAIMVLQIQRYFRKIELLFEVGIRKVLHR